MKKFLLGFLLIAAFAPFYSNAQCTLTPIPDYTACGQRIPFFIGTTSTGFTTFAWSSSGTGSFDNSASLASNYTPSVADIAAGTVTFTVIASGGSGCTQTSDEIVVTLAAAPTVNAGPDQSSCADFTLISGTYTGDALGLTWTSSGTGIFAPNANSPLNYRASTADTISGSVTLTATTYGNTMCTTVSDQMKITYVKRNFVQIPNNSLFSCLDAPVTFSGVILANASGVIWTSNGTGSFANTTALNPTYTPSADDITRGNVDFTVTTTGNNDCPAGTHFGRVAINNTGNTLTVTPDKSACVNTAVSVQASFTGATGIQWSSSGAGTFAPNTTFASVTYTPSAAENSAGKATLTATTTGNGACPGVTKDILITLLPADLPASVSAGPAPMVCAQFALLNGSATNAKGVVWTTSGSGSFSPSPNYLHATYMMSGSDMTKPSITLTLTSTGCNTPASSQVTITPAAGGIPALQAGPDQTVSGTGPVTLAGIANSVPSVIWSTTGSGAFSDNTSLTATYTPSTADVANGLVRLTLTSVGSCMVYDYMYITIGTPYSISGTVKAGANNLDNGLALLFKQKGNTLNFVAATTIAGGSYSFQALPSGDYTIMATPVAGSIYFATHLPTYSGGTQDWKTAQTTTIGSSSVSANITLSTFTTANSTWNTGADIIAGVVYASSAFRPSFRQIGSDDQPLENVTVYLTNAAGDKIAYTKTSSNGSYKFQNVKAGAYKIVSEYGGAGMEDAAAPLAVSADGNGSTIEDGTMLLASQSKTSGVMSQVQAMKLVAYPNPANTSVSVDLVTAASSGVAKLINQNGMTAFQQEVNFNEPSVKLNIESLPAGIYLLQIVAGDELYTSKVVKF